MKTSTQGVKAIAKREGTILHVYRDSKRLPTAGVGHLLVDDEKKAFPVGTPITQQQCDEWLVTDLKECEDAVNSLGVSLKQNEYDSLVSLAFNIGVGAASGKNKGGFLGSTVARKLKAGDKKAAAGAILLWDKPPEIQGRRRTEYTQFLTPYKNSAAPAVNSSEQAGSSTTAPLPDNSQPPITQTDAATIVAAPAIAVPQAVPAEEKPDIIARINTRFTALGTSAFAALAALWAAVKDMAPEIIITLIVASGVILLVYVVLTKIEKISANKQEQETKRQREAQAHDITMLQGNSQARKDLNAVVIVPQPIQNSEPIVDPVNQV